MRLPMSSQWPISAVCTAVTPGMSMRPLRCAMTRSGASTMVISSNISKLEKPER